MISQQALNLRAQFTLTRTHPHPPTHTHPHTHLQVIVSTKVEGHENPVAELAPGFALLGSIMQRFDSVTDCYEPVEDGLSNRCFISKSYDETSHFQSAADDVLDMYYR